MTRVLIVDDNQQASEDLAGRVRAMGYETSVVSSAELAAREMERGAVDVLVADLKTSQREGVDMVRLAQQVSPDTRSVLVAGEATAREYKDALDGGAVDLLIDPRSDEDLDQALRKAAECAGEGGFHGSVHGLSLIDLLQLIHHARRSVAVRVGPDNGEIHLCYGQIVHASAVPPGSGPGRGGPLLHGRPALAALLATRSGTLSTSPLPEKGPCTIDEAFEPLLLDMLRQLDEQAHGLPASPAPPAPAPAPAVGLGPTSAELDAAVAALEADDLSPAPLPPQLRPTRRRRRVWPVLVGAFALTVVVGSLLLLWLVVGAQLGVSQLGLGADPGVPGVEEHVKVRRARPRPLPVSAPLEPLVEPLEPEPARTPAPVVAPEGEQDPVRARVDHRSRRTARKLARKPTRMPERKLARKPTRMPAHKPVHEPELGSEVPEVPAVRPAAVEQPARPKIGTIDERRRPSVGILE
jgi:CheY-like chemotaxis protein